eukprot:6176418-Pleurochrysis_carterae.AAC.4
MDKKNEHRARVQRRWDNRQGIMKEVFQKWKSLIRLEHMDKDRGSEQFRDYTSRSRDFYRQGLADWTTTLKNPGTGA